MKVRNKGIYLAILCIVTYILAYLCRVNISSAIVKMADGFGVSKATIGIFGTLQALIYATGQMLNGPIITRYKPAKLIAFAAIGTALANLLISFTSSFTIALIIWCVNAYIQSLFWGSIVRLIDIYPESRSSTALMCLMLSMSLAFILSWTVIGSLLADIPDWHPYFRIPGILMLFALPFWLTMDKTCPETEVLGSGEKAQNYRKVLRYIHENRVYVLLAIGFLTGFIREGIIFWAPVMLDQILTGTNISPYLTAAIIPIARTPSSVFLARVLKRTQKHIRLICIIFALVLFFSLVAFLLPGDKPIFFALLLAILTFLICTIGSMMSLYVPLTFAKDEMSAPLAGILDAIMYIGASVSTLVVGKNAASENPTGAAVFWAAGALAGVLITIRKREK